MKKSSALLIAAALILSSCGTVAQYASSDNGQKFQDGIYSNTPAFRTKTEKVESKTETQALVEKTKSSVIYLFGDKKDTVMIPQDMSATIKYDQQLGGTVVTVGENPYDWRYDLENNYGYYYGPYSIGSSWYWSRHYSPWFSWSFSPWRYHGWYDPWYYSGYWGWYDPWYYSGWYGGWYDPWYYGGYYGGYWGWYDPWYHHHHHGWYDPYWDHHHHGPGLIGGHGKEVWYGSRHETGSDRVFASGVSTRGGIGTRSTISRNSSAAGNTATRSQASSDRVTPNRVTTSRGSVTKGSSVSRSSVVRTTPSVRENSAVTGRQPAGHLTIPSTGTVNRATSATRPSGATVSAGTGAGRPAGTVGRTGVQANHRRPAGAATTSGTINGSTIDRNSSGNYRSAASATRQSSSYERNSSSNSYNRSSSSSVSRSSGFGSGSSGMSRSSGSSGGGGYSRSGGSAGGRR